MDRRNWRLDLLLRLEPLFHAEAVAAWLGLPLERIDEMVRRYELPVLRIDGEVRFHGNALRNWLRTKEEVAFFVGPFGPEPVGLDPLEQPLEHINSGSPGGPGR